ncbi:MAG: HAD family phosphatase [Fulvivirga sp.]
MIKRKAKYLLFDLGGVIINLDVQRTINELAGLAKADATLLKGKHLNHEQFKQYETGAITDEAFRSFLKELLQYEGHDQVLDEAWNAMILDIPLERLQLLERLRKNHTLFLLSNTNTIHMKRVNERLLTHGVASFDPFFDKQYYSHLINRRKPDADCYAFVLEDNKLEPEDVLFIDDNEDNIKGAANLGIHTLHINTPRALMDFFDGERH